MSKVFPIVPLEMGLRHRSDFIEIDDLEVYKRCRVQLRAQGIIERDFVQGTEVKTKKQQVCHAKEFLVAEIDAKLGGFGIVPENLAGAIVSSHYFLFTIDESVLNWRFLDFVIRTPTFMAQVRAKGTTNYAAIRPSDVLQYKIPLPSLEEQHSIVTRIEKLAARIEKAQRLRREIGSDINIILDNMLYFIFTRLFSEATTRPIHEVATIFRGRGPIYLEGDGKLAINQKCVRWEGIETLYAKEVSATWFQSLPEQYLLQKDDLVVNSTGEGTIGRACIVTPRVTGLPFDSHLLVVRTKVDTLLPKFLAYFLRSPGGQSAIEESKGAKTTKQTELGAKKLGNIFIPLPSSLEQQRIVVYLDNLQSKLYIQQRIEFEITAKINAMLPSILDKAFQGEL